MPAQKCARRAPSECILRALHTGIGRGWGGGGRLYALVPYGGGGNGGEAGGAWPDVACCSSLAIININYNHGCARPYSKQGVRGHSGARLMRDIVQKPGARERVCYMRSTGYKRTVLMCRGRSATDLPPPPGWLEINSLTQKRRRRPCVCVCARAEAARTRPITIIHGPMISRKAAAAAAKAAQPAAEPGSIGSTTARH